MLSKSIISNNITHHPDLLGSESECLASQRMKNRKLFVQVVHIKNARSVENH